MPPTAVLIAVEQKVQSVSPANVNSGYGRESVLLLVRFENIRVYRTISDNGCNKAQPQPSSEYRYRILRRLTVIARSRPADWTSDRIPPTRSSLAERTGRMTWTRLSDATHDRPPAVDRRDCKLKRNSLSGATMSLRYDTSDNALTERFGEDL